MALSKISSTNILYVLVCLVGIAAFFLVGIYPNMRSMDQLDAEVTTLTHKVQSQELLYPVYRELIKEVQQPISTKLLLPDEGKLSSRGLNQLSDMFRDIATKSDVVFESAVPDASSYLEDAGYLTMHVSFSGDFFNFHKLLFNLCGLPYLESIDQMRIESEQSNKLIVFKLKLVQK
jgi:uncharacterized membrane protein